MITNSGINKIILLGQVANLPDLNKYNNDGFLSFTILTIENIKKGTETTEHFEHHNVRVPAKLMTNQLLMMETGQTIYIEGKAQTSSYIDDMRVKRYNLEIVAQRIEPMGVLTAVV